MTTKNEFGRFLQQRWAELELTQAEFCRRIGSPPGWIQQIREGVKTPPLKSMPKWASVLKLTGDERQWFFDTAAIAHLPDEAEPRFAKLLREVAELKSSARAVSRARAKS